MPRQPRVVAVGAPHHLTQRGNNRIPVFCSDADRLFYLDTLRRKARAHGLAVLGWCLGRNRGSLARIVRSVTDSPEDFDDRFQEAPLPQWDSTIDEQA